MRCLMKHDVEEFWIKLSKGELAFHFKRADSGISDGIGYWIGVSPTTADRTSKVNRIQAALLLEWPRRLQCAIDRQPPSIPARPFRCGSASRQVLLDARGLGRLSSWARKSIVDQESLDR